MKLSLSSYAESLKKNCCYSWTILIIRFVVGLAFTFHGWGKIQHPFSWMPPEAPIPAFFQGLAAISEFGGGIAWLLGLLNPLASFGIFCTMGFAAFTHMSRGDSFVGAPPSYELAAVYFSIALFLLVNGPGKISLDYVIFGRKN